MWSKFSEPLHLDILTIFISLADELHFWQFDLHKEELKSPHWVNLERPLVKNEILFSFFYNIMIWLGPLAYKNINSLTITQAPICAALRNKSENQVSNAQVLALCSYRVWTTITRP
jgi:hypothetical protein